MLYTHTETQACQNKGLVSFEELVTETFDFILIKENLLYVLVLTGINGM